MIFKYRNKRFMYTNSGIDWLSADVQPYKYYCDIIRYNQKRKSVESLQQISFTISPEFFFHRGKLTIPDRFTAT